VIPPHEATTITPPDSGLVWDTTFAGAPGRVVGHIDVCPENTVFRDGRAVAFIDFHFAAPTDPVLDLAHLLRMWVPLGVAHDPRPHRRLLHAPARGTRRRCSSTLTVWRFCSPTGRR
jgi:aminoglycoside phosphotransferase (APT) family kinase protein